MYEELHRAIDAVMENESETEEFKRRLRRLIEQAVSGAWTDDDVRDIIHLSGRQDQGEHAG